MFELHVIIFSRLCPKWPYLKLTHSSMHFLYRSNTLMLVKFWISSMQPEWPCMQYTYIVFWSSMSSMSRVLFSPWHKPMYKKRFWTHIILNMINALGEALINCCVWLYIETLRPVRVKKCWELRRNIVYQHSSKTLFKLFQSPSSNNK
jgi:hypothetical protein